MSNSQESMLSTADMQLPLTSPELGVSTTSFGIGSPFDADVIIQVHLPSVKRYRRMEANEAMGFRYPIYLIEMLLHSPGSNSDDYNAVPIWIALPCDTRHSEGVDGFTNSITAAPLWNLISSPKNAFNCAIVSGNVGIANVPNLKWDQSRDCNLPEAHLNSTGVLSPSNIIIVDINGLVPVLAFDHTAVYPEGHPLNYQETISDYGYTDSQNNRVKLRSIPIVSKISGYGIIKPEESLRLHELANIRQGIWPIRGREDGSKFASYGGYVFKHSGDKTGAPILFNVFDNPNFVDGINTSERFMSNMKPGVYSEFMFNGVLLVTAIPDTLSSAFRARIDNWRMLGSFNGDNRKTEANAEVSLDMLRIGPVGYVKPLVAKESDSDIPWDVDDKAPEAKGLNEVLAGEIVNSSINNAPDARALDRKMVEDLISGDNSIGLAED